ncbi:MAG: hypothetical protein ABJF23_08645 [Bryobacteraceae bacterium]
MNADDIRKLLGGYATGTLSANEQQALFEAALNDEKLFAALADEHALREMLDDPANRAAVLRALEPQPRAGWRWRWIMPLSVASVVVIASIIFVAQRPARRGSFEMAKVVQPALQPEILLEQKLAVPAPSSAPLAQLRKERQALDRTASAPAMRDAREELRARAITAPVSESTDRAPAVAPSAPPPPPPPPAADIRAAKKEALEGKMLSGYAGGGGFADRMSLSQGLPGKLQYTILKRGPDGQFKPVAPSVPLQPEDAVRLNVEAGEAGYLSVVQKEPSKVLFQGAVQKQVPVTIPATGSLDLSMRGALQILFSQPNAAGSLQNALLPGAPSSKGKAVVQRDSEKAAAAAGPAKDQAPGIFTVDVNLNMATPSQQQK